MVGDILEYVFKGVEWFGNRLSPLWSGLLSFIGILTTIELGSKYILKILRWPKARRDMKVLCLLEKKEREANLQGGGKAVMLPIKSEEIALHFGWDAKVTSGSLCSLQEAGKVFETKSGWCLGKPAVAPMVSGVCSSE